MTFSFFKTVFVSIRFSFFVSELPMEIATRVPVLPEPLLAGAIARVRNTRKALSLLREINRERLACAEAKKTEAIDRDCIPYPFDLFAYPFG